MCTFNISRPLLVYVCKFIIFTYFKGKLKVLVLFGIENKTNLYVYLRLLNNLHTSFRVYIQFASDGNQPTTVALFLASCISSRGLCCFRIMWIPSALTYSTWLSPVSFWKPLYNSDRSIKTWIETRILKRQLAPVRAGATWTKGHYHFQQNAIYRAQNAWGSQSLTAFWCELEWPVQGVAEYNMRAWNSRTLVSNYMGVIP